MNRDRHVIQNRITSINESKLRVRLLFLSPSFYPLCQVKKKKENKRVTIPGGFSSPIRWAGGGRDARGWIVALTDVLYVVGFHATAVIFLLAWKPLDSSSSSSSSTSSLASPWSSLVIVVPLLVGETRLPNRVGKKSSNFVFPSRHSFSSLFLIFVAPYHERPFALHSHPLRRGSSNGEKKHAFICLIK